MLSALTDATLSWITIIGPKSDLLACIDLGISAQPTVSVASSGHSWPGKAGDLVGA